MSNKKHSIKKPPVRMCIACRQGKLKEQLLRIVKNGEGEIFIDFKGKAPGRGAYICGEEKCINKAAKQKLFNKVFSCEIPSEVYEGIKEGFLAKK